MDARSERDAPVPSGLREVDKSDLSTLISGAEGLAESFHSDVTRLEILVSGLTSEAHAESDSVDEKRSTGLGGLTQAQERMSESHNTISNLIDRLNSLVAL